MRVFLSEDIWDFDLEAALAEISEQRREQALKFKHELGQRLCVLAYQLLKQGLSEVYGITENPVFEYNEHGKPSIVGHPEIFSTSVIARRPRSVPSATNRLASMWNRCGRLKTIWCAIR